MSKNVIETPDNRQVNELCEDMEMVGPGQMLAEARKKLSLSVADVADKLKFKQQLVDNIEQDIFDQKLPATYNRGYLRCYAKFVNVDVNEVLSAYDMLGVAEVQRSEMQSFSNLTEKQAEHSRLMWFSYLIVAILLGLMVLWWFQAPKQVVDSTSSTEQVGSPPSTAKLNEETLTELTTSNNETGNTLIESTPLSSDNLEQALTTAQLEAELLEQDVIESAETITSSTEEVILTEATPANELVANQTADTNMSTAIFTFSGDCWVNIFDATGERIAWGVKKSGYIMTISGEAPLKITLGRPELASIMFNEQPIDMSNFNAGNIAKFTLPINL